MASLSSVLDLLFARLLWTSLQAVLLGALVALLCRLLPRLPAATRTMLWWLVGAQLLLGLLLPLPVELPVLAAPTIPIVDSSIATPQPSRPMTVATGTVPAPAQARASDKGSSMQNLPSSTRLSLPASWHVHWRTLLAALWLAISAGLLLRLPLQWYQTRCLLRRATPLGDELLRQLCREQAQRLRLRRLPSLHASTAIASPQVCGLWHPVIVLPAAQTLSRQECALALTHELAHLRRGDLWMSWIPALAQRLFFFHPLAHWAAREYALHREAACDAEVMRHHDTAHDYGQLLLRLGIAQALPAGLGSASPSFHALRRRLAMLQQSIDQATPATRRWSALVVLVLIGTLPYRLTAHGNALTEAGTDRAAFAAPADSSGLAKQTMASSKGIHDGFAWVDGDISVIEETDINSQSIRRLQHAGQPLLLVHEGNTTYALRDPATLQQAKTIVAPLLELSQQQQALARQQVALGHRQIAYAQQRLRTTTAAASMRAGEPALARQPDLSEEQRALAKQQDALANRENIVARQVRHAIADLAGTAISHGRGELVRSPQIDAALPLAPPVPPVPPAPPVPRTAAFAAPHVDIDTHPDTGYGYALLDKDAITVNGTEQDLAAAKRLEHASGPLWWFRKGNQAYVVRDDYFVAQARALYAPLTEAQRDAGRDEGARWKLLGPLQGLQSWQASVAEQRKDLLADPTDPALHERLASLDRQQQEIASRTATLQTQLAALTPKLDAMAKQRQLLAGRTHQRAEHLIGQALRAGAAQPASLQ